MIAKLIQAGDIVATLEDSGEWTPEPGFEYLGELLNLQFDPRDEMKAQTGSHHAGWGSEEARKAAMEFSLAVEYPKREPLPDGSIS